MNLQNQINYLKEFYNEDMFDGCSVPEGLDMARVRGAIVMRCGLLTPLYSEPEVQKAATQQFFFENQWNFRHILEIVKAQYSPIENVAEWRTEKTKTNGKETLTVDRHETEVHSGTDARNIKEGGTTVDAESGTTTQAESGSTTQAESGSTVDTMQHGKTTTREISAENASTYQADTRETLGGSDVDTVQHGKTDTTTHGKTDTTTHGRTDTTTHGKTVDDNLTHGHKIGRNGGDKHTTESGGGSEFEVMRHGNIGVTTNQKMINEELDLLERFNPYRFIAELYERELIIGIY